ELHASPSGRRAAPDRITTFCTPGAAASRSVSEPVRAPGLTTRTCSITNHPRPRRAESWCLLPAVPAVRCGSPGQAGRPPGRGRAGGGRRGSRAAPRNEKERPAGGGSHAVGGPGADPAAAGVAPADFVPGHLLVEQDLTAGIGSDHAVAGQACPESVDRALDAALQHGRSECVEVVLTRQQEDRGDALELRA